MRDNELKRKLNNRKDFIKSAEDHEFLERVIRRYTGLSIKIDWVEIVEKTGKENPLIPTPDVIVHTTEGTLVHLVLPESISKEYIEMTQRKMGLI